MPEYCFHSQYAIFELGFVAFLTIVHTLFSQMLIHTIETFFEFLRMNAAQKKVQYIHFIKCSEKKKNLLRVNPQNNENILHSQRKTFTQVIVDANCI